MPVARGPQINARSALLVGMTGVAIALLLGAMVVWVAGRGGTVQVQLGDTEFDAGFIGRQSEEIDARGPILYADAGSGGDRDLIVQHIGDDPELGWLAFSARRVGDPRDCFAEWDQTSQTFSLVSTTDQVCDNVSFTDVGCGLFQYPAEIIDGKVIVFLNQDFDEVAEALSDGDDPDQAPAGPDLNCPLA